MIRIQRAVTAASLALAFAACSADPFSPDAAAPRPSLMSIDGSVSATSTELTATGTTFTVTATACTTVSDPTLSGTSTYIVAYSDPTCAAPTTSAPVPPTTVTVMPGINVTAPAPDTLSYRLTFY
jgi:hypothetical protein